MTYNILDFGAKVCDTLQTEKIQAAIDECFKAGGGEVIVPSGIYRTGGLRLRSNVALHMMEGAILEGSDNPEDYFGFLEDKIEPIELYEQGNIPRSLYPYSRWMNALIRAIDAENISIIGEKNSYINGVNCFDAQGEEKYRGPHAINIYNCKNVTLKGYSIRNSANWAHAIFKSTDIVVENISVYGGHDGFDVFTCDNVIVKDCIFKTGDDCVAGFDNHNVLVKNCLFDSTCSALRFGGTDVVVEDCKAIAPASFGFRGSLTQEQREKGAMTDENCRHNMVAVFTYYCDFRLEVRETPGNIVVKNCEFENADILFRLQFDDKHVWCCNRSLDSIRFENCKATGLYEATQIHGDINEPLAFELENVELSARDERKHDVIIDATNYKKLSLKNVTLKNFENPEIIIHNKGEIIIENTTDVKIRE